MTTDHQTPPDASSRPPDASSLTNSGRFATLERMESRKIAPATPNLPRAMENSPAPPAASLGNPGAIQLAIRPTQRALIEALGFEDILEMISAAVPVSDIADALGVPPSAVHNWLQDHPRNAEYQEARRRSAEMEVDKAGRLINGLDSAALGALTGPRVGLLKLQHDHHMRRASLVNSRYRDKAPTEDAAPAASNAPAAPQFVITIAPGAAATIDGHTIEG